MLSLSKCFMLIFTVFFSYRTGQLEELQYKTLISLFIDNFWLLYAQPIMSEGNTADTEIRATLNAVKKDSRLSNGLLKHNIQY